MEEKNPSNQDSEQRRRQFERLFGQAGRSDFDLHRDIVNALGWDSWVNGNTINVEVMQGVVTLTGTVRSSTEKRAAGDDAWDIPGVLDVQNQLQIIR